MNTKIILSSIVHKRFGKIDHLFRYKVPSIFLDLDELDIIKHKSKIFSVNSFNLFSFNEKDHGYRDDRTIKDFIVQHLNKYKIECNNLKIMILCFPRIFGYVFDPLSIIYCYDDKKLISIFYEVKNTTNEQHTYIFKGNVNFEDFKLSHECAKQFYVSPFIEMEANYKFFNRMQKDKLNINIDLYDKNNKKVLTATQHGKFIDFNSKNMFKFLYYNPLLGFKVMAGILYEALKIIYKGGKYYARNKKPNDTVSFEGNF